MKKTTSYVPESRPYTFTAEQMEPFTPQPRENLGRSEDEDDSDYRMVSAIVSAIRSTRPKAKQISNEDLRNICLQAIREGQTQNPSWIDGQIHRLWEQAQKANPMPAISVPPKPIEAPWDVSASATLPEPTSLSPAHSLAKSTEKSPNKSRTSETLRQESSLKKRKGAKSPLTGEESGTKPETNSFDMPVLARSSRSLAEGASWSESLNPPKAESHAPGPTQDPQDQGGEQVLQTVPTTAEQPKTHEDPLLGIVPTEVSAIIDQEHLLRIHEQHQIWKSSVLNPRANSAQGRANFRGLDLRHLDFSHLDFSYADFSEANVAGIKFIGAKLVRCHFVKAQADGGDFTQANLRRANFSRAHLGSASFLEADLRDADFAWAQGAYVDALKQKQSPVAAGEFDAIAAELPTQAIGPENTEEQPLFH